MNNPEQEYPKLKPAEHADDLRLQHNFVVTAVNFLIDRYNGVELPAYDPVTEWAANNGMSHMARNIQEAAYNAANPNAPAPSSNMDPVQKYAAENGLSHMSYDVQQAAYNAANGYA